MTGGTSADAIRLLRRQFDFTSPELTLARYGRLERLLADLDPSQ